MILKLQIITFLFSFLFGMIFSLFLRINYKIIYNSSKFIKLLGTILIVIIATMSYFLLLKHLNEAIFHPYHMLALILGFALMHVLEQKIVKLKKK